MATSHFWYNGQATSGDHLPLPLQEPGLIYGATVFTTLRIYQSLDHPLTQWLGHQQRLETALEAFQWPEPDWQRLRSGAEFMAQHHPVLRMVIFPDGREWITGRPLPADLQQRQKEGITAWVADPWFARSLPNYKTGNYLAPWLALQQAQRLQAQEAILTNAQGHWLETSTGNLWGWQAGRWWTPPLEIGILSGLLREHLIRGLKCQNETVMEDAWTPAIVRDFTAIAYTNCVMEVIPVHTVLLDSYGTDRASDDRASDDRASGSRGDRGDGTGDPMTSPLLRYSYDPKHPSFQTLRQLFATNPSQPVP